MSTVENIDTDDATLYGDVAMWNDYLGLWEPSDDMIPTEMKKPSYKLLCELQK